MQMMKLSKLKLNIFNSININYKYYADLVEHLCRQLLMVAQFILFCVPNNLYIHKTHLKVNEDSVTLYEILLLRN